MPNKSLFQTIRGKLLPQTDAVNEAGGRAYAMSPRHALAQYAMTGCLNGTFYATEHDQLTAVLTLCEQVEPEFIARVALAAREQGFMKDMPALLCGVLSVKGPGLLAEIFDRAIDSPKMLRNFVQIMRSGVVGRKSLGTLPKRLILQWIESRTDDQLFNGSIGNDPSLADIIKMVHPVPSTPERSALFGYLIGREHAADMLPERIQQYEKFKRNTNPGKVPVPDVPFQLLTSLPLTEKDWRQVARNASWQTTRMNLNTFWRHGVFNDKELIKVVANRLRNPRWIAEAKAFPYQLLAAYLNGSIGLPDAIRDALEDAMEVAINNVPHLKGKVYVFPDISGSMHSPVTGVREGATTKMKCIHVAALVAASILRRNRNAKVIPFESKVASRYLDPNSSVMTNARILASLPAGGTNCSAPLKFLNEQKAKGDLIVYVSDNESWVDSVSFSSPGRSTETMKQWQAFKKRNPQAKMVCIDVQPYATTQAVERPDIVNVGGFSDRVFNLLAAVANGESGQDHWVNEIEKISL